MQLTWMGHSCIRIEQDGFVTVIDPGILSAPDAAAGADALLISHRHLDHYDTGFLVDGRLFHPGDAFTDPGVPVELLLLQLIGFYTKTSLSADYVKQLRPSRVAPIHDATLTAVGQQGEDAVFSAGPPAGLGTGVPYFRPAQGVPFAF
jgi:L-ascorbate metabolism protein UlaG (beta-lactamase superfamily)